MMHVTLGSMHLTHPWSPVDMRSDCRCTARDSVTACQDEENSKQQVSGIVDSSLQQNL